MSRPINGNASHAGSDRAAAMMAFLLGPTAKPEPVVQPSSAKAEVVVRDGATFVTPRLGRRR